MRLPIWSVLWMPIFLVIGTVALIAGSNLLAFTAIAVMLCGPALSILDNRNSKEANNAKR